MLFGLLFFLFFCFGFFFVFWGVFLYVVFLGPARLPIYIYQVEWPIFRVSRSVVTRLRFRLLYFLLVATFADSFIAIAWAANNCLFVAPSRSECAQQASGASFFICITLPSPSSPRPLPLHGIPSAMLFNCPTSALTTTTTKPVFWPGRKKNEKKIKPKIEFTSDVNSHPTKRS